MANWDVISGAATFRLFVTQTGQNIAANQSTVAYSLQLICGNGVSWNASPIPWSITINGSTVASGNYTADFRSTSVVTISTGGTTTINHNADGTKTISVGAYSGYTGMSAIGGPINISGSLALTTIPRATTPTVSPTSGNTGSSYTITHTPAVNTFYHDVAYSLDAGGSYTNIATNVVGTTTTTPWTPAHTLLPNSTGVTAIIRVITRQTSGGTILGTKTVNLALTVPVSVKPTISAVTWADGQVSSPNMPSLMGGSGRFVQRWSKLIPTVTSAGAGGSTVTDTDVTQNGQTTNSGAAFTNAIALSGAVPYTAYASDSRNRTSDPYVNTVAVTAYNFPNLPTPAVQRTSDALGATPSPTGTYLRITPAASVSSLNFSGEKNLIEYQIRTRAVGGSYTTKVAWTATGTSGTTWTTPNIVSSYLANTAYEVEISIRDLFGKNAYDTGNTIKTVVVTVPSEAVFMDWDEDSGIGIGEYRRASKMLSVAGQITQNAGLDVIDTGDTASATAAGIVELATDAETQTGTDTARAITPANLSARTATSSRTGIAELATDAEVLLGTDSSRIVTPSSMADAIYGVTASLTAGGGGSATMNAFGLITFTSCTSLAVDGCFLDGYDYEIVLHNSSGTTNNSQFIFRSTTPADLTTANYQRHAGPIGAGGAGATDISPNTNQSNWTWNAATTNRHQVKLYLFNPRLASQKIGHVLAFGDTDTTAWAAGGSVSNVMMNVRYSASTTVGGFKITFSSAMSGTVHVRKIRVA